MAEVIEALGKCGSEYVLPDLTVGLRDEQKAVRQAAVEAMVRVFRRYPDRDSSAAKPYLNAALKNETDPFLGVLLISALAFWLCRAGLPRIGPQCHRPGSWIFAKCWKGLRALDVHCACFSAFRLDPCWGSLNTAAAAPSCLVRAAGSQGLRPLPPAPFAQD